MATQTGAGWGNKTSHGSNLLKADSGGGYSGGNTSSNYGSGTTGGAGEYFQILGCSGGVHLT